MEALFIGQTIIEKERLPSSNSYMGDLLKKSTVIEGLVVWTKEQTEGRGQRENYWESEANKNLCISIALFPSFLRASDQFQLTKIASLGVADFVQSKLGNIPLQQERFPIKIKWPNDIYAGTKKICGILIENTLRDYQIANTVLGIGVNINQTVFNSAINAVSLKLITGKEYDLKICLEELCRFIEARYLQLKASKLNLIDTAYTALLYRYNEWSNYLVKEQNTFAKITGISPEGKLMLELESGDKIMCGFKEVVFQK